MSTTTEFTVTHPNGAVSKRNSKRDYTHAVVVYEPKAVKIKRADDALDVVLGYISDPDTPAWTEKDRKRSQDYRDETVAEIESQDGDLYFGVWSWHTSKALAEVKARGLNRRMFVPTAHVVEVDS